MSAAAITCSRGAAALGFRCWSLMRLPAAQVGCPRSNLSLLQRFSSQLVKSNGSRACLIDTLALVRRLEKEGAPSKQAEAIASTITEVLNESLESVAQSFVSKPEMQRVRRLEKEGVPSKQAEAITSTITEVLNESLESVAQSFVSKPEMQRVWRLEKEGVPSKQAEAITSTITEVLNESLESVAQSFVSKPEMQRSEMIQDSNIWKFKLEMKGSQVHM